MRVLFITPYYYPNLKGGSERSLQILAEGLAKKGLDVSVMSFDGFKKKIFFEFINGVRVIRIKKPSWRPLTLALNISLLRNNFIIKKEKPDIIHIYNTWQIPAGYFLKRYAKVIATLNNYYPLIATSYTKDNLVERGELSFFKILKGIFKTFNGNLITRFLMALFYSIYTKIIEYPSKNLDAYIAYADAVKRIYVLGGFDKDKIKVIPNPSENEYGKLIDRPIKRMKKVVLYVGGIMGSKGFYEFMNAIKILGNKTFKFWIVGPKKKNSSINELISEGFKVKFFGRLDKERLSEKYRLASILVHPSQWPEPFSRVWMEALYYKIPIISSDNPIAREVLDGAAIFYKRGYPEELAEKIDLFFKGKLKTFPNKIKKRLFSSSQKAVDNTLKMYKLLISK